MSKDKYLSLNELTDEEYEEYMIIKDLYERVIKAENGTNETFNIESAEQLFKMIDKTKAIEMPEGMTVKEYREWRKNNK